MSASRDRIIRRLKFLYAERNDRVEEVNHLSKSIDTAGRSGFLRAIIGDPQTTILSMQQMNARIREIGSEVRKIDYEIEELELQLKRDNDEKTEDNSTEGSYLCNYCGSQMEVDTVFCPKCRRAQPKYLK
jgi:hypothetical protein